jgi:hypothetical protein
VFARGQLIEPALGSAELFRIANGVAAGIHHITVAYEIRTLLSRPSIVSGATETRSAALALGG